MASLSQIRRLRIAAKEVGGRVRSLGSGNDHHLIVTMPNGRKISVWYPADGRCGNAEERDVDEVISFLEEYT